MSEDSQLPQDTRTHFEGLGNQWTLLVGNPKALMPQVVGTVIHSGATRESWKRQDATKETFLLAWPQDEPIRAGVVMQGAPEGELKPVSAMPLMEGFPNDFMVEETYVWQSGVEAHVGVEIFENKTPLWFYNPLYFRDKEDLTPGVTHTFLLSGLAFGLRKALLDELTITNGPAYEAHAISWLAENPGKTRLDVPVLKVALKEKQIIMPGRNYCEYEIRNTIVEVEKSKLDKLEVYMLRVDFVLPNKAPLNIMLYVPVPLCKEYEPQVGDEIDAYIWLQGRITDV